MTKTKRQTLRSIIADLIKENNEIEYYDRSDRGIVITKINGQKYSGKKGNQIARSMVGASLSRAQRIQLKDIGDIKKGKRKETRAREREKLLLPKATKRPGRQRVEPLPSDVQKELRKLQRIWRQNKVKRKGHPTTKRVRQLLAQEGPYWTLIHIKREQQYAQGYAYEENVNILLDRIKNLINIYDDEPQSEKLKLIYNKIYANKGKFKEELIADVYSELYEIEKLLEADLENEAAEPIDKLSAIVGV